MNPSTCSFAGIASVTTTILAIVIFKGLLLFLDILDLHIFFLVLGTNVSKGGLKALQQSKAPEKDGSLPR